MPSLDKTLILSRVRQEDIFETYGVPITDKLILSPFRKDTKPSCKFYTNKGKLVLYDHGLKTFMDCFDIVKNRHNCDYNMALKIIAKDFEIDYDGKTDIGERKPIIISQVDKSSLVSGEEKDFYVRERPFNKVDKDFWNFKYSVTSKTLNKFKVFPIQFLKINDRLAYTYTPENPGYAYYLGDKKYKVYFPYGSPKFLQNTNSKVMGYRQLPETGELLIITKSMKDIMCLSELGYTAISMLSETSKFPQKLVEILKERFKRIVLFYDNDKTGLEFVMSRSAETGFPYITLPGEEKDLSDFIEAYDMFSANYIIQNLLTENNENGYSNLPF